MDKPFMHEELLLDLGLTHSEIAVYFALLKLGSSTTGPIIDKAKIASGKAYLILGKLVEKGLVTHVIKSGTKYYQAKDPERLIDLVREKQDELAKKENDLRAILPTLKAEYEEKKYSPKAEIFEGIKGFKTFYEFTLKELKKGDTICILGVPSEANKRFQAYLLDWNKRRIALGIKMKIIYNSDCRKFGKARESMDLTEVKYMKEELETPAWIDIFNDYVVTINVHGEPVCFLIKNKESAESYRNYFELVWKQGEK